MAAQPEDHLAEKFSGFGASEKIEWMIETKGWALEVVPADYDSRPQVPAYAYSVGLPAAVGFPEVVVFGLTPVASQGLLDLVVDARRGGTEIPLGVELVGLLDNDLRCVFAPIDTGTAADWFSVLDDWYGVASFDVVQLMYPDRNGVLPFETGFEQRMRLAQPVVGRVEPPAPGG